MDSFALQIFVIANAFVLGIVVTLAFQQARAHVKQKHQKQLPVIVPKPQDMRASREIREKLMKDAEMNFGSILHQSAKELERTLGESTLSLRQRLDAFNTQISTDEMEEYKQTLEGLQQNATNSIGALRSAINEHQAELVKRLTAHQAQLEGDLSKRVAQLEAELNERQAELEGDIRQRHLELQKRLAERQTALVANETALENEFAERRTALDAELQKEIATKKAFIAKQIDTKLADIISSFLVETLGNNVDLGAQSAYLTEQLNEHKAELTKGITE